MAEQQQPNQMNIEISMKKLAEGRYANLCNYKRHSHAVSFVIVICEM
jgi:hypothetical protein